ncbi:LamG domain-containing protein [bacterium]|nr:LamG domain-containing protein [bacterium]
MFKFRKIKKKKSFNLLKFSIFSLAIIIGIFLVYNYSRALIFKRIIPTSGLAGHWTMDQVDYISSKMQDKTIYNHDATNYGATFTTDRFGKANSAMYFSGDYLQIANPLSNQANLDQEWTVSAWVDVSNNDDQYLIDGMNKGVKLTHSSTNKPLLYLNSSTHDYYIYGNTADLLEGQGWKHIVFVFQNSTGLRKIYIDGVDVSGIGINKTSTPLGISSTLRIGYSSVAKIDDLKIFNRALSESEVKAIYSNLNSTAKTFLGTKRKSLILDMPLTSLYTKDDTTDSEVLADKTPQSNDGQNVGASVGSEGTYFNGSTDYISVPNSPSLNKALVDTYNFTIATWFKPTSWVSYGAISKGVGGSWSHSTNSLWVYSSGIRCVMGDGDISHSNLSGSYIGTSAHQTTLNEWHHVVCKGDGTNLRLYIDGELKDTKAISGLTYTRKSNTNPLIIGRRTPTSAGGIAGTLKNLKIYDRPITDEEITKLYNEKVEKKTQVSTLKGNLVLDLPLKSNYTKLETTGSEILTDRTPYSNDGQNYGASIGSDSASFSGSLQNIIIPAEDIVIDKGLTLSAWIKPTSYPSERATIIVSKYYLSLYNNGSINTYWYDTSSPGYHQTASGLVPLNEWTHVLTTWDGTQNKIYINGVLKKTTNTSGLGTTNTSIVVGAESSPRQFLGEISNVLIYNDVLSATEVESLYSKGRGY